MRRYHFDLFGRYVGWVDPEGRYYDRHGACRWVVKDGKLYDSAGECCGHVDVQGQIWDENGAYRGYLREAVYGIGSTAPPPRTEPARHAEHP